MASTCLLAMTRSGKTLALRLHEQSEAIHIQYLFSLFHNLCFFKNYSISVFAEFPQDGIVMLVVGFVGFFQQLEGFLHVFFGFLVVALHVKHPSVGV